MAARYAEAILSFQMFQGYTPYGLEMVLERGHIRELAPGEMLYRQGESATFVALVVEGVLELFMERDHEEVALGEAGASRLLGELAVLAGVERIMSARAKVPTVVALWNSDAFQRLIGSDAQLSQRIFRETFRSIVEEHESLVSAVAAQRGHPAA